MRVLSWIVFVWMAASAPGFGKDLELAVKTAKTAPILNPLDAAWNAAPGVVVPMMPQTIAPPGGGGKALSARVKAIQTEHEILFRVDWQDASVDDYPSKAENFTDAVALQFPAVLSDWPSPFMGDAETPVVIWCWSASAQKDLDAGYQSNSSKRPRMAADMYAYAGDATFRAAEKAGNIIANRRRISPVENLAAKGFGTLTVMHDQPVQGKGVRHKDRWYVVFRRSVTGTPAFLSGNRIPIALAVWDGGSRERNGIKSVSSWHSLALADAGPRPAEDAVASGRRHYLRYGCGTCHGPEGRGGVANPNAQTNPIPALERVKEGFTKDEIAKVIQDGREPARKDPNGPPPPYKMNAWKSIMDASESDALIEYLFSLMKEDAGSEW